MNNLVYPHEKTLGSITLVLGIMVWLGLILGTFGVALLILALGFVLYLFAQSALIAHIKGNGVKLSEEQFPDLYSQFINCCNKLQIAKHPQAYILNGNGGLNAFATKFLGAQYVVLMTDIVDAMEKHEDGVSFYIGHELGHLRMKHLTGQLLRWPVLWLPLLGAAYSRARESTCDRHGLACSSSPEGAARALAALSAGVERWRALDVPAYLKQVKLSAEFWMSFHELNAGYPWLTKRIARVMDSAAPLPKRNPLAYLLSMFVPYAGRMGGAFGLLIIVYVIGVLAAIAIPAYQDYITRATMSTAVSESQAARDALASYYESNDKVPESLEAAGIGLELPNGGTLSLDSADMKLFLSMEKGELVFIPSRDSDGHIKWNCEPGEGLKPSQLPDSCKGTGQ